MFEEVRERLAERQVDFAVSSAARERVVTEGYDPDFGARPLRRTIERRVENPLAKRVLAGEFEAGDRVLVDVEEGGEFTFARDRGTSERGTAERSEAEAKAEEEGAAV